MESTLKTLFEKNENHLFKSKEAAHLNKEITSVERLDDMAHMVTEIDRLASEGKAIKADIDVLHQNADGHMRALAVSASAEKKKKDGAIKIVDMKKRVARMRNISNKLDGIEQVAIASSIKISNKLKEIQPAIEKLKVKQESIRLVSENIDRDSENYQKLEKEMRDFTHQSGRLKVGIEKLKKAHEFIMDRLQKIQKMRKNSELVVQKYIKEAMEVKHNIFS